MYIFGYINIQGIKQGMFIKEENKSDLGREWVLGGLPLNKNPWRKKRRRKGKAEELEEK